MTNLNARSKKILIGLILVILCQTAVLGMVYVNARIPLWTGEEIRLKTIPVDPRSLFRGNYARLRYDISEIPGEKINRIRVPKSNEPIYVMLSPAPGGIHVYRDISFTRPETGPFIRGRVIRHGRHPQKRYRIRYGIEAYFAPKEKALALERKLQSSAVARIFISDAGKAALDSIHDH
ncbi:MAG: GDYXXLXY domain-containing protein [Desulfobacterales bacterium]|nr:GDYXXLXY domain-containing protein [Desulfobacterales bacterium]